MWLRLVSFTGLALICAVVGTVVQALLALHAARELDSLAGSAITAYDMSREVPRRRPFRRLRHRQVVRQLLTESPAEAAAYRRLLWTLWSWSALATGSVFALVGHVITS